MNPHSLQHNGPGSGLFLSDLHLFSRRSVGQQRWEQIRPAIAAAQTIVLGGDMFDFRWSQMGDLNATIDAAQRWLEHAIAINPQANWVYLLGNHDCHPRMQAMLNGLAARFPNFSWTPGTWRIGSNVFLHGDVLEGRRHAGGLDRYRSAFHDEQPRGALGNLLYSAVIETRLHDVVPRIRYTNRQTCRRILDYLEGSDPQVLTDARNVYFGHTHVPLHRFQCDGYDFFNTGCGIRYQRFAPASFEVT